MRREWERVRKTEKGWERLRKGEKDWERTNPVWESHFSLFEVLVVKVDFEIEIPCRTDNDASKRKRDWKFFSRATIPDAPGPASPCLVVCLVLDCRLTSSNNNFENPGAPAVL